MTAVMPDFDVVIIGCGPSGMSASLYLTRGKYRSLVIDKESLGGQITKVEWIENYPGFSKGIPGPQLASEMLEQAVKFGLQVKLGEVVGIELDTRSRYVLLSNGKNFTTRAIIIASGCRRMKLGVPGEMELQGRGVFSCALCDGGQFLGKKVAVCGGGDTGLTEALYMTKLASKVILLEATPVLTASLILQERACHNEKLEIHCNTKVTSILGSTHVEALELEHLPMGEKETLLVDGVLVDIGMEPNTGFLHNLIPLDVKGRVLVDEKMATGIPYVFAAGDVRSGSAGQVVTGVSDGAIAAISIQKLFQQES
jgi:thioredoxin reductase (NADPH)